MKRKGRTHRKRLSSSQSLKSELCFDKNFEIIELKKWTKSVGYLIHKKIKLAEFSNTGRGVMALENVAENDIIMQVPFNAIITICNLESDTKFRRLFFSYVRKSKVKYSCQEFLAFYLSFLTISIDDYPFWVAYLKSLPCKFNNPYFYTVPFDLLYEEVYNIVSLQKEKILKSYENFRKALLEIEESYILDLFTLELYEWAYFVVNTRCVYVKPDIISKKCKMKSSNDFKSSFLSLISDEPNLALIPYLDMFNHSFTAKTSANLLPCNKLNNNGLYLDSSTDVEMHFELITLTTFKKYEEIFISYGNHCNLKLLTEYGFRIAGNPFSNLSISFEQICSFMKESNFSISKEKFNFIIHHKLNQDLYIAFNSYSFNFLRLLFILTNDSKSVWNLKIYTSEFSEDEFKRMDEIGRKLLHKKKKYLKTNIDHFCKDNIRTSSLSSYIDLINEYISLIEGFVLDENV